MNPVPLSDTGDDINRFLEAQEKIYPQVLKELRNGKKTSHWMWFIFPQIEEYIAHPVLGKRLLECANIVLNISAKSASAIFGYPDDLKLRSSMTLFNFVAPEHKVFAAILKKYFAGNEDQRTPEILKTLI